MAGNSTKIEIWTGDATTVATVNTFIEDKPGIEVLGPVQIAALDPAVWGGQTLAYLLTYRVV